MKSQVTNAMHREQARISLTNQWGTMAWITFLVAFAQFVIGNVVRSLLKIPNESTADNVVSFLLSNFLFFALTYGTYYCALKVVRGEKANVRMLSTIFQGKFYVPMVLINLVEYVVQLVLNFIVFLPVLVSYGVSVYFSLMFNSLSAERIQASFSENLFLVLLLIIVSVVSVFLGMFISGVFQFAVWAKLDDSSLQLGENITYAFTLMKGRFGQYLLLQLSFIGWYIIGALVVGIGLFWVVPYHNVAIASFYDTARKENGYIETEF